ncbi:electron transfer flavoprotein subunit alpha [Candidatus Magnetomorum sp. HK-1]|nr:electron transfer flavoprotein subunit alpha [Candidatus Magnetomorum sp. HK-1]
MQIFAYIINKDGKADDTALELALAAKKLDSAAQVTAIVAGSGIDSVCQEVSAAYNEVWKIDNAALAYPDGEIMGKILPKILPEKSVLLMAHEYLAMDMAPGLAVRMDTAYVADVTDIEGMDGNVAKLVRQEFSGMVSTHNTCDLSDGAILTIRPGVFASEETPSAAGGSVVDKSGDTDIPETSRKYLEIVEAEVGDVDISNSEILVSVGRGIEEEDNIEIVKELAEAMGADYSCSRPIVDAKWMEKSRQVGTSGKTVKPKVYLAMGISGAFQHLGGIKGSPFMIAINKNPKAPIFQVADIGVEGDILDIIPELTEKVNELKG